MAFREPTREQERFAERIAEAYGRSRVERLGVGPVVEVVAMIDDVERATFHVDAGGRETETSPFVLCAGCGRPTRRADLFGDRDEACFEKGTNGV